MPRVRPLLLLLAASYIATPLAAQACGTRCGTERWAVKTFTDPDTALVDLMPREGSVLALRTLARPSHLVPDRRSPVERRTYRVRALLIGWKYERGDDDLHIVIADPAHPASTMIVEIPSPNCSRVCSSRLVGSMTAARQAVIAALGPPSDRYRLLHPAPMVTVTGIGFFDFLHGQTGVAPNGIELHPVIDFRFDPPDQPDTVAILTLARDLSADSMRGRGPYTRENLAAARRLAAELTKLGARPLQGGEMLVPFVTPKRPADTSYNVIAVLPDRHGDDTGQLIGITSHLDHLGVGPRDANGDSIYNGFLDDALPAAMVMDVARRYARTPGDRPLVVMYFNLEEEGLLGSEGWVERPDSRAILGRLRLVIEADAGSPAGEALTWELVGALPDHPFARLADSLAQRRGWTTRASPPRPISDFYPFARAGIPTLFPIPGAQWKGYTSEERGRAMARWDHYHQPADQYTGDFPLVGTAAFSDWLWEIVRGASHRTTGTH